MWLLPSDNAMTVRRIEKPLRDFVVAVTGAPWDGDRLAIVLKGDVRVECARRDSRKQRRYDLYTGYPNDLEHVLVRDHGKHESYWVADLYDGEAAVIRRYNRGEWNGPSHEDTVTIYLTCLWKDEATKGLLDVARDAAQQARAITPEVYRIAKEALPRAHGLVVALLRKELSLE